jgi:hypothetical protein
MNIFPLEFSIVVVGQDCNPTLLNPDFLKYRGIVPEEWGWEIAGAPITTPPFAVVAYDSGITIKVETNRFQVSDQSSGDDVGQSKAIEIAVNYIQVLPHVRYTGVGINFRSLVEMEKPDDYLVEYFLKTGPLSREQNPLLGVSLKFVYPHDDARLSLSLAGGVVIHQQGDTTEKRQGVLASGNYHRDCQSYPADALVIQHINRAASDAEHFSTILTSLLSGASGN